MQKKYLPKQIFYYNYIKAITSNTSITINNSINTNLHIYFTQVVYGTSKYLRANITKKLVGPIIETIPYTLWNNTAYTEYKDSSVTCANIVEYTPATV